MEKQFNPGDLRHRITFLSPPTVQDDYGALATEWSVFKADIWASKEPILGNEYFSAQATQSEVEVKFRMRYLSSVLNTMRIQHGTEIYQILSVINVKSLNRELLCYCKELI